MSTPDAAPLEKPLLRGVSHQWAFFLSLAAGSVLVLLTSGAVSRWGALVYAVSLAALFGVSALYHRPKWAPEARRWMRRLDHAAIFVLIAGTTTPLALSLESPARERLLAIVWAGAAVGVLRAVVWISAPKKVVAVLALLLGWASMPFLGPLRDALGPHTIAWIAAGGVLYSLGAVVYARKRPDPWPKVFGYHEVFHALVVAAAVCHFVAVTRVVATGA